MALDLGTLVARVTVETDAAERGLSAFERKLLRVARTQVPDIAVDVATAVAEGALQELAAQLRGLPDGDATVDAETRTAVDALADIEDRLRGLPDADATVGADTRAARDRLEALADQLRALPDGATFVDADTRAAVGSLDDIESRVRGLPDGEVTVRARAEGFDDLEAQASDGGRDAGDAAGEGLSAGILAALATIPLAGGIALAGVAIGRELVSGLQSEVREDTLVARTGLDPGAASRIGRAAGEAYAANFGESIEANFDTARAAVQGGLLDPDSTARDSQAVIQSLTGVADILGEDIPRVVRATSTLLKSGLVGSAEEAFDLLVKGQQEGANAAEDLLDTFTEYPAVLERLGLTGADSLGLISQGLQAGARDSDFVADALKEFQIRATDGSKASADAFDLLGLSAEDATAQIARGGEDARAGLDEVLDGLRAIEDPVKRNEAAVGLFGTKAEDLGDALFALDLDTVAADLGTLEGAASGAISALGDNAAGQLESAQRNIEIAKDGILAAVAEAFGPQIEGFAESITGNREAVVTFLLDVANGFIDVGRVAVEAAASGTEGFGDFVGQTGPAVLNLIGAILEGLDSIPFVDLGDARQEFDTLRLAAEDSFAKFDEDTSTAADTIRRNLIENGLDPAQERLNEVGFDLVTQARFTDSTTALAAAVADIGYKADGTKVAIDLAGGAFDTASEAGARLDEQIRTAADALDAQTAAGREAGRTVEELSADYAANRDALIAQLEAMGLTREEAVRLTDSYGAIPDKVTTVIEAETARALAALDDVKGRIDRIQDKSVTLSIRTVESLVRQETAMANRGNANPRTVDGRRADGGPISRGGEYLVGEEGPELIVAPTDGFVIPAGPTAQILANGLTTPAPLQVGPTSVTTSSRGGDTYIVQEAASARRTAEQVMQLQRQRAFEEAS